MNHTPAPWNVKDLAPMKIDTIEVSMQQIETKFGPIATVISSKSNARLIAVAPELLAMLEKLLPKLSQLQDESAFTLPEKVESLINKAKGL